MRARSYATGELASKPGSLETPPDVKHFGRGKRTSKPLPRNFGEITLDDSSSASSDDEICIISEKINPKTKMKFIQTQKRLPSSLVKTGKAPQKKKQMSLSKKNLNPIASKKPAQASKEEEEDPFADDEDLSCRLCLSAFWYKTEILDHLKTSHKIQDPESFLRNKKESI